ncbi:MAG TPA: orotidine-5'-phosphate decarboxylase [Deltaproteobacteria bacterium]|nr:orotidine-5'-phosphate decarboxylase [Deltaproteobacteria bacterium]
MRQPMSKLIVALDGMDPRMALQIASELVHLQANGLWGFKIGHSLTFTGAQWIDQLKKTGKVFVDLKLYDIPSTVEKAVDWLASLNVDLTTVHLSMGRSTLEKIADRGVGILGVSLLTSAIPDECKRIYGGSPTETLLKLFRESNNTGITGVVCSPQDLHLLDLIDPDKNLLRVCPGIREIREDREDQKRTMTPAEAVSEGANFLVVGRPIVEKNDYVRAAHIILNEISRVDQGIADI